MPAFAEQFGQARIRPDSSANTSAKRSETCDPQWSQLGMVETGSHHVCRYLPYAPLV
jgi:hypothetical protein